MAVNKWQFINNGEWLEEWNEEDEAEKKGKKNRKNCRITKRGKLRAAARFIFARFRRI